MTLDEVLARLKGVRAYGGYYTARCPAHHDRNASLSIREDQSRMVLLHCFAGCGYRAIVEALGGQAWRRPFELNGSSSKEARDDGKRTEFALRIWREALPAAGTLVETYLRTRGITMPVPPSLRFHARLKHPSGAYLPAMVAAVQHVESQIIAIHRTFLAPDGSGKGGVAPAKMMLGPDHRRRDSIRQTRIDNCDRGGYRNRIEHRASLPTLGGLGGAEHIRDARSAAASSRRRSDSLSRRRWRAGRRGDGGAANE